MTPDVWLTKHPYLQGVADLQALVDTALAEASFPTLVFHSGMTTLATFMPACRYSKPEGCH